MNVEMARVWRGTMAAQCKSNHDISLGDSQERNVSDEVIPTEFQLHYRRIRSLAPGQKSQESDFKIYTFFGRFIS